ncbi:MAG: hypothetical protein ACFFA0_15420 [Promethearchaeota archaeon]
MKDHIKQDNYYIIKSNEINEYISIRIISSTLGQKLKKYESYDYSKGEVEIGIFIKEKLLITVPSTLFPSLRDFYNETKASFNIGKDKKNKNLIEIIYYTILTNLTIWSENDYNTQLIDYRIAFPLLKELCEVGETKFQIIFQQEIIKEYITSTLKVKEFLKREGYMNLIGDFF